MAARSRSADGRGQAGDTVDLFDGATLVGTGTVGSNGAWQITTSTLAPGVHSFSATETNTNNLTSSASASLSVTIVSPPLAPSHLSLDPSSAPGTAADAVTTDPTPQIDGKGAAGDTVTLFNGATILGTGVVGTDGKWSIVTKTLLPGAYSLTAIETDTAGDVSPASAPFELTIAQRVVQTTGSASLKNVSDAVITTSNGTNLLSTIGNHDTLIGGTGNDEIVMFGQNSLIDAGAGQNTIFLFGGYDTVTGGGGDNQIYIDGNDVLTDGPLVFNDTVTSFSQATGDRIHLTTDTVADALAHTTSANGGHDTLISLSNGSTILLKAVSQIDSTFFS